MALRKKCASQNGREGHTERTIARALVACLSQADGIGLGYWKSPGGSVTSVDRKRAPSGDVCKYRATGLVPALRSCPCACQPLL
jgi:hypothetical protein